MNKRGKIKSLVISILFILIFVSVIIALISINKIQTKEIPNSKEDIINDCKNLLLFDTVECLIENIKPIYQFRITEDNIKFPFSHIKKYGGDCKVWSELHIDLLNELGYNSEIIILDSNYSAHVYVVVWDLENIQEQRGYCQIDGINFICYEVKN